MIHSVVCASIVERDAMIKAYTDQKLTVTWYGPDAVVRAEHLVASAIAACANCAAGPNAYLVVACPAGEGPSSV
jgi:hypothetical protein